MSEVKCILVLCTCVIKRFNVLELKVERVKDRVNRTPSQRGVTCHMGSHTVTCPPTQVNTPL